MPWEINIESESEDKPLGTKAEVARWFSTALPGVEFGSPPLPPKEFLDSLPPAAKAAFENNLGAVYLSDDVSIEFFCSDKPIIDEIGAEVRGNGNPLPVLAQLCMPQKWVVVSMADRSRVDLSGDTAAQWQTFCEWRDDAIDSMSEED